MTPPTFQELLTSQEARENANWFHPRVGGGTFWMNRYGDIFALNPDLDTTRSAIWQGYIQEAAPPPEPRVFKVVRYFNVYEDGIWELGHFSSDHAEGDASPDRIACVRVEITAIEGQYDD